MKEKLRIVVAMAALMALPFAESLGDFGQECQAKQRTSGAKPSSNSSRYTKYTGTVGNKKVTVFLDSGANGYYYYGNGSRGKLTLRGKYVGNGGAHASHYYLYEYNSGGQQTAVWDVNIGTTWVGAGQYVKSVTGEMTANGKTYDVELW